MSVPDQQPSPAVPPIAMTEPKPIPAQPVALSTRTTTTGKIIALEALRGIASLMVFVSHFWLAFAPHSHGLLAALQIPGYASLGIVGTPWFAAINATAAVTFFFVLSGYVLSIGYFRHGRDSALISAVLKRWPRLAMLTTLSTVSAALLMSAGAYLHQDASALSDSTWLRTMGSAGIDEGFSPSIWHAFLEGVWRTFVHGEIFYNSNLWTMRFEFFGSFLVFALAWLARKATSPYLRWPLWLLLGYWVAGTSTYYLCFVLGLALAYHDRVDRRRAGLAISLTLLAVALYFYGYFLPIGTYAWLPQTVDSHDARTLIYSAVAVALVWLFGRNGSLQDWLQNRLARWLGEISFPLYLLHPLVLFSFSSWLHLQLHALSPVSAVLINLLLTSALTLSLATLMARLDSRWVSLLNRVVRQGISKRVPHPHQ
ncbi:MAG TPA: acyltransferase [Aquimonas sp.]|nr:acyltransferase [Aquimonas sp.]